MLRHKEGVSLISVENIILVQREERMTVIYTSDGNTTLKIVRELYDEGVFVNAVLPPATPENECLIRTSLMANITKDLIDEAADKIALVLNRNL